VADTSRVWPWLVAGAGLAIVGGVVLRRWSPFPELLVIDDTPADLADESGGPAMWGAAPDRAALGPVPPGGLPGVWVWPLPTFEGRRPVVSDGWGSPRDGGTRRHRGVDIMYRRSDALDSTRRPGTPSGSRHHVMPDGVPVLAVHDGTVWSAGWTPRGHTVVIDHGRLIGASYYTHLDRLLVTPTEVARSGQRVTAGQAIGTVGADPMDHRFLKHLHFAFWRGGPTDAIDPAPLLVRWRVVPNVPVLPAPPRPPPPLSARP
jgi:murein DD-endopeptidase MepM/ murein hydrolase activator NlpD